MNLFRILGDLSHLASLFILIAKMRSSSSASGISFKSQFLYMIVYATRYVDLLWTNPTHSLWNTTLKIIFIAAQAYIVWLMLNDYKPTHDPNQDTFKVEYLLGGAAVLAILFPYKYIPSEMLWAFSIWLESVAILPQLFMLQRTGSAETITTHYIFALGAYRALYIPNWIWRYAMEGFFDPIPVIARLILSPMGFIPFPPTHRYPTTIPTPVPHLPLPPLAGRIHRHALSSPHPCAHLVAGCPSCSKPLGRQGSGLASPEPLLLQGPSLVGCHIDGILHLIGWCRPGRPR